MRLINADALRTELECAPFYRCNSGIMRRLGTAVNMPVTFSERETLLKWKDILAVIDESPTIEAEPVRHGSDIWRNVRYHCEYKCSECGAEASVVEGGLFDGSCFNYCPNCGAKMGGGSPDEAPRP